MDDLKNQIEKYLKGELNPSEMHGLEMRALNDPFLADALEGAESIEANQFSLDIKSINKKVKSKAQNIYLWPLRIAASILVVVVLYYIVIQTDSDLKPEQLALQKNESAESQPVLPYADTLEAEVKETEKQIPKTEKQVITSVPKKPSLATESDKSAASKPAESIALADDSQVKKDFSIDTKTDEMEMAAILDESSKERMEEAKSEPASAKQKELKKSVSPQALSGGGARQAESKSIATKDGEELSSEAYQKYLKANVKYPKAAIENKIEGTVTVSFKVGADGALSDFIIEKGIGYGCDEELIRLIKEGPVWNQSLEKILVSFIFEIKP